MERDRQTSSIRSRMVFRLMTLLLAQLLAFTLAQAWMPRMSAPVLNTLAAAVLALAVALPILWWGFVQPLLGDLSMEQNRFAAVLQTATDGILIMNDHFQIESINHAVAELFRFDVSELVGKNWTVLIANFRDAADSSGSFVTNQFRMISPDGQLQGITRDGTIMPLEVVLNKVRLDGKPKFVAIVRDITERKRVEAAIEEHRRLLQTVFTATPDFLVFKDRDLRMVLVNAAFCHVFRCQANKVVGLTDDSFFPPEEAARAREEELEVIRTGEAHEVERPMTLPIGRRWLKIARCPVFGEMGEHGQVVGLVVTTRDISDLKRIELELRSSEERFATLFRFSPVAISILTYPDGIFADVNEAWQQLLGLSRDEVVGKTSQEVGFWNQPRQRQEVYQNLRDIGEIRNFECQLRHRNGDLKECLISVKRIHIGGRDWVLGSTHDVTERKRFERELVNARDAAKAANEAKSKFLKNMSHELRTPMNGIVNLSGELLATGIDAEQRELLENVKGSADALTMVLNDILDLSVLEAGQIRLEPKEVDLHAAFHKVLVPFLERAKAKQLLFETSIAPNVPEHVRLDFDRLRQVLTNLIGNAIKFTSQGSVHVTLSTDALGSNPIGHAGANRTCVLKFEVVDSGMGISPEYQQMIFEPFRQLDAGHSCGHGGTGLGLAIVHRLLPLMGGRIGLKSSLNQGSKFWFTLPVQVVDAALTTVLLHHGQGHGVKTAEKTGGSNGNPPSQSKRILVAEDNSVNQMLIQRLLSRRGYDVKIVPNGRLAVEAWRQSQYDLILMDLQMPEMDGFEALVAIREEEQKRGIHQPIIALTAYAMVSDRERCLEAGFDQYLAKPYHPQDLFELIEKPPLS